MKITAAGVIGYRGIFLGIALMLSRSAMAQFVELEAQIEISAWHSETVSTRISHVHCVVGTNSWMIEGDFYPNSTEAYWFTGTNIVETRMTTEIDSRNTWVHDTPDGNPGRPEHELDLMHTLAARVAWLAFCSGPSLKREGGAIYPPSDFWKQIIPTKRLTGQTIAFEDTLGLPRVVDLTTPKGQPVFQYRTMGSTNVLDWEFPLEFSAAQYQHAAVLGAPRLTYGTNGWQLYLGARGKLTGIRMGTEPQIPPDVLREAQR
jgi:hypothetical protein